MTATTARYGVPYATSGDSVASLDQTLQAMAEHLDLLLGETGDNTVQAAGAGEVSKRINYARTYPSPLPIPRATVQLSSNQADLLLSVHSEDRTGFSVRLRTATAGSPTASFRWYARVVS